jgi:Protein of unknown function (DUF1648)
MNARLAIPVIGTLAGALLVKLLTAWGQLPDRVAVHFGMAMQPNGWSSKSALAAIVLIGCAGPGGAGHTPAPSRGQRRRLDRAHPGPGQRGAGVRLLADHQLQRRRNSVPAHVDVCAHDRAVCFHYGVHGKADVELLPALARSAPQRRIVKKTNVEGLWHYSKGFQR